MKKIDKRINEQIICELKINIANIENRIADLERIVHDLEFRHMKITTVPLEPTNYPYIKIAKTTSTPFEDLK